MEFLAEVGYKIKLLRQKNKMTQEELAFKVGYTSRSSINKIEKGLVDLPQSKIAEIADALGTSPAFLMGWEDDTTNDSAPEISENRRKLIDFAHSVPEEKVEQVYSIIQSILEALR